MYKISSDGYILLAQSKIPTFDNFLRLVGVLSGSFASKVLQGVYNNIYVWSEDLKREYFSYYSIEYDSFERFLNYMVGLDFEGINIEKQHLFYFEPRSHFIDPNYEDNYLAIILNKLEENDED